MRRNSSSVAVDEDRVVAMSLHGSQPDDIWGVIRCALLLPVYLSQWTLRVHVSTSSQFVVPDRVLIKLRQLGADIVQVPQTVSSRLPPRLWRLMAGDDMRVRYFLQRDADWRLGEQEAASVSDWTNKSKSLVVHCVSDRSRQHRLIAGLWGAQPRLLRARLNGTSLMKLALDTLTTTGVDVEQRLLESVVWPAVFSDVYWHERV